MRRQLGSNSARLKEAGLPRASRPRASRQMLLIEVGRERNSTIVAFLVDTNVLVYRFDDRAPHKQAAAVELLRKGLAEDTARIPHQALLEFFSVTTRDRRDSPPLLTADDARHETEELMSLFPILYPNASLLHTALLGAAAYKFSWFDAHMWAYAEHFGLKEIISEDFLDGRLYGSVRVRNPFRGM